jgi:arylsulfatase A-like enzyme
MSRNVVLLILDTVRKDYFDEYAPRLQAMSDTAFEQCRAASSCSVPSHGSILTGNLPHKHGIHSNKVDYSGLYEADTILSAVSNYRKVGISANTYASSAFGFDELFDEFIEITPNRRFPHGIDVADYYHSADADGVSLYLEYLKDAVTHSNTLASLGNAAVAQFNRTLSKSPYLSKPFDDGAARACALIRKELQNEESPTFVFANVMDAHWPMHNVLGYDSSVHDAPRSWSSLSLSEYDKLSFNVDGIVEDNQEYMENYREVYAASIDYLDRKVADLIETVAADTDCETTFIITADHGENLGFEADRHLFSHKASVTEALLHVPFVIVNGPDGYESQETEYVSHLSLEQIIEGVVENEDREVFQESIAAELVGAEISYDGFSEEEMEYWGRMLRSVYHDETKFVWDSLGTVEQRVLDHERPSWECHGDERDTFPDWVTEHFDEDIDASSKRLCGDDDAEMAEATKARLERLGYL